MDKRQSFFDRVGSGLRSLDIVIFAMLTIISAMIFFSHTLFGDVFPDYMEPWEKYVATWAMALSWELTVLITTVNSQHIGKRTSKVMAICSGIIVLFFIRGFDDNLTTLQSVQRVFVGALAAYINYIYAELFNKKWHERHELQEMPYKLNQLKSQADEAQSTLLESESKRKTVESNLIQVTSELNQLRRFKEDHDERLKCPYCKTGQHSADALRAHKGHCNLNPKKMGVQLNGHALI